MFCLCKSFTPVQGNYNINKVINFNVTKLKFSTWLVISTLSMGNLFLNTIKLLAIMTFITTIMTMGKISVMNVSMKLTIFANRSYCGNISHSFSSIIPAIQNRWSWDTHAITMMTRTMLLARDTVQMWGRCRGYFIAMKRSTMSKQTINSIALPCASYKG